MLLLQPCHSVQGSPWGEESFVAMQIFLTKAPREQLNAHIFVARQFSRDHYLPSQSVVTTLEVLQMQIISFGVLLMVDLPSLTITSDETQEISERCLKKDTSDLTANLRVADDAFSKDSTSSAPIAWTI